MLVFVRKSAGEFVLLGTRWLGRIKKLGNADTVHGGRSFSERVHFFFWRLRWVYLASRFFSPPELGILRFLMQGPCTATCEEDMFVSFSCGHLQ